jgi:DNA-binding MurR/RpiR family transcriptional regulator
MVKRTAIEVRLAEAHERLNPRRRRLIQATLENPDETFFLSARALARRYKVDPATIVRTIQALGYRRYADFAADLREHFIARLSPYRILEASTREKGTVIDHVRRSLDRDMNNLSRMRSSFDPAKVVELAKRIHNSRRIAVIGVDLAAALSRFLAYGLLPLGFDAESPEGSAGNVLHRVRLLSSRDLLIAISFGRCLRLTVDALRQARDRGVPTFGITNSDTTPIARYADAFLLASTLGSTYAGSYVAPMALLNAVLLACSQLKPKRSLLLLRQTEEEYLSGPRWYDEVETATPPHPRRSRK